MVAFSIYNDNQYITISKIFNQDGIEQITPYQYEHDSLLETSNPKVASFQIPLSTGGVMMDMLWYIEKTGDNTEIKLDYSF